MNSFFSSVLSLGLCCSLQSAALFSSYEEDVLVDPVELGYRECCPPKVETCKRCCHDLLSGSTTALAPITIFEFPTATPVPLSDESVITNVQGICRLSDTMFALNEPGYYFIEAVVYPITTVGTAFPGTSFAFQIKDVNGRILFESPRAFDFTSSASPIYLQQIYRVDCTTPRIVQLVAYAPNGTVGGIPLAFEVGRSSSIDIFRVSDPIPCKKRCH